jgi:hypothetical protein
MWCTDKLFYFLHSFSCNKVNFTNRRQTRMEERSDGHPLVESDYDICSTYPRVMFKDDGVSIRDAGLFPSGSVVVEENPWDE